MPIHLATRACCLLAAVLLTGCIHPSQQSTPHAPGTQAPRRRAASFPPSTLRLAKPLRAHVARATSSRGSGATATTQASARTPGPWSSRLPIADDASARTKPTPPTRNCTSATAVTGAGASTTGAACVVSWCATWPPPATRKPGTWSLFDPMCLIAYRWLPVAIRRHVDRQFQHCSTRSGP